MMKTPAVISKDRGPTVEPLTAPPEARLPAPAAANGSGGTASPELLPATPEGYESLGRSALRHPFLVGAMTALGIVVGAGVGYLHHPTYSAQAQLVVGRLSNLAADQVPGFAAGVQSLASDYARLATSGKVIVATEHNLHTSSLPGSLSASPVPQSNVINVIASAPTAGAALKLANAGASALTSVVLAGTNDTLAQLDPLMAQYTKAEHAYQAATAQVNILQHNLTVLYAKMGNNAPTPYQSAEESAINKQIVTLQTEASKDQLQANTYYNQYQAAVPAMVKQEELLQQTGPATSTGSDRKSFLEAAGLVGVVGGLAFGLALAVYADTKKMRRQQATGAS